MQINLTTKEGPLAKILKKLTMVFLGIFLTSGIFAVATKFLGKYGLWLGLFLCGGLIFCGFYYVQKGTRLRLITWTMLISIIAFIVLFLIGLSFLSSNLNFQEAAN